MKFEEAVSIFSEKTIKGYTPVPLPYDLDALEPHICKDVMDIHYNKHYKGYIKKLNDHLKATKPLVDVIKTIKGYSQEVRQNAGGAYNHALFWSFMTPTRAKFDSETFESVFNKTFKSVDKFKEKFTEAALDIFGSGWCWVVVTPNGKLQIVTTPNQDNPLMDGDGVPIFGLDCWEHSYYLQYANRRDKYVKSFFEVANWRYMAHCYFTAIT